MTGRRTIGWMICLCGSLWICSTGCVRRRLMVRTNPPGASVYVDHQYIGTSPAATSTTYYGTREIEVVADGYRTEKVQRTFTPPWYEWPPLDFISETLWPWELRDERIVDIAMVPMQKPTSQELVARADALRLQASQGVATPVVAPATAPPTVAPPVPGVYPAPPPSAIQLGTPQPTAPLLTPGAAVQGLFQPGGQPVQRIPEVGILPGGGYRPALPQGDNAQP
ncbi:MAG: PEGA domain-containing protein [Planctomycetota bacterium]|nr:MAG: PEGA domain-containing protein [Planctomycetota bacterium]